MKKWKRLSTETRMKNPWWEYRFDRFELPDGRAGEYHYVHTDGSVFVIAVNAEGKISWNRQYRYLFDLVDIELPGGGVKSGQTPEQAAAAELAEESGVAGTLALVGKLTAYDGVADEYQYVFIASDLRPVSATADETEEFESLWLSPEEIEQAIAAGTILSSLSVAAWHLAKPRVLAMIDAQRKV